MNFDNAVGVNAQDRIYYRNGSGWARISGALEHASYGTDGSVWGANSANRVYRRAAAGSGSWQAMTSPTPPPTGNAVDLLLVSAHPDDEGIFSGGILPYYAQIQSGDVVALTMVTRNSDGGYPLTAGSVSRVQELRNAIDVYAGQTIGSGTLNGLNHYQSGNITLVEGGMIDTGCCNPDPGYSWGTNGGSNWGRNPSVTKTTPGFGNTLGMSDGRSAAAMIVAREIRRFRPAIVASSHDLEGDYGHSNHTASAIALIDGYELAADSSVDIEGLAPWRAEKLYLRGSRNDNFYSGANPNNGVIRWGTFRPETSLNPHFHDGMEAPVIAGQSARYFAEIGVDQHISQGSLTDVSSVFKVGDRFEGHHSEWWTLYKATTGGDTVSNFTVSGDRTGTNYVGWSRGNFAE